MTSRLRKIYFINVKTSGKTCSGRITEVDPRGGAAITGTNGAGKTTVLQLIPLFFGHSPSKLTSSGENKDPILQFVLPYPECAIAFEYQRGDDPTDICLSVLRRQAQSNAPDYRFLEGQFRKEYFIAKDVDTGEDVFLDDARSVEVATRMGYAPSAKHESGPYRNVILNTIGVGKEANARKNEARRFSFSKKRLPYLDSIVAAAIKSDIHVSGFKEVVASIVTSRMNGTNAFGNAKYPQLHQSKEQIEIWLRDRDGADRALKLKPVIDGLREALITNQQQIIVLRQKRSDVSHLKREHAIALDATNKKLEDLSSEKITATKEFSSQDEQHKDLIKTAENEQISTDDIHRRLLNRKLSLEDEQAEHWAEKSKQLPTLINEAESKSVLIKSMQENAQAFVKEISENYDLQISNIKISTANTSSKMKDEKESAAKNCDREIELLDEQERNSLNSLIESHKSGMLIVQEQINDLLGKVAHAKSAQARPEIAPELEDRLSHARTVWNEHQNSLIKAQSELSTFEKAVQASKIQRDNFERKVQDQKQAVRLADEALVTARHQMQPVPGSLHETLLNHADDQWRDTLARVINPSLLNRTDLSAHLVDEDGANLFGWAVNLDAIEAPSWTQRDTLDQKLEIAKRAVETAKSKLEELEKNYTFAEAERLACINAFDKNNAQFRVIDAKTPSLKGALKVSEDAFAKAKSDAKSKADIEYAKYSGELKDAQAQLARTKTNNEAVLANEKSSFSIAKAQTRTRRDQEKNKIEQNIRDFEKKQDALIKDALAARDRELTDKGIDTVKLNAIKTEYEQISTNIREIRKNSHLVIGWNQWVEEQGATKLVEASALKNKAEESVEIARKNHEVLKSNHQKAIKALDDKETSQKQIQKKTRNELEILADIEKLLTEFPESGASTLTTADFAAELKAVVKLDLEKYERIQVDIRKKLNHSENELCGKECTIKEFFVGVNEANQDESLIGKAERMTRLYDRIGREVIQNVNTSLSTILDNISEYRKTLLNFESEVKRFNNELQDGFKRVSCNIERLADLTMSAVTDFEKIDFIGKLKLLDDIVLEHKAQHHSTYTTQVPPLNCAEALRSFMMALSPGAMEINLGQHIVMSGSVTDDGNFKKFDNINQVSSTGLSAIALTIMLSGLINVIRGSEKIYIPWSTDEIGTIDAHNFPRLIQMLHDNMIDLVTSSPALTPAAYGYFAQRYVFQPQGVIAQYKPRVRAEALVIETPEKEEAQ